MPVYKLQLPDGTQVAVEQASPPTEADYKKLVADLVSQKIAEHQARADYEIGATVKDVLKAAVSNQPLIGQGDVEGSLATIPALPESAGYVGGGINALNRFISGVTSPVSLGGIAALATPAAPLALSYLGAEGLKAAAEEGGRAAAYAKYGGTPSEVGESAVNLPLSTLMAVAGAKVPPGIARGAEAPKKLEKPKADPVEFSAIEQASKDTPITTANAQANQIATKPITPMVEPKGPLLEGIPGEAPFLESEITPSPATGLTPVLEALIGGRKQKAETAVATDARRATLENLGLRAEGGPLAAREQRIAEFAAEPKRQIEMSETQLASGLDKKATTLGDLIGQEVRYEGYSGTLIRDSEGNFGVLRPVVGKGKPNFIEIADTGKDVKANADALGVVPEAGWEPVKAKPQPAEIQQTAPVADGNIILPEPNVQAIIDRIAEPEKKVEAEKLALESANSPQEPRWRPFLTDFSESAIAQRPIIGAPFRWLGDSKIGQTMELGFQTLKNVGIVSDNIGAVSPPVAGHIRLLDKRTGERAIQWWDKASPGLQEARKVFGKNFDQFSSHLLTAAFTGDITPAAQFASKFKGGKEVLASLESDAGWRGASKEMADSIRASRPDFEPTAHYYPLVMVEGKLPELMKALGKGKEPANRAKKALKEAEAEAKRPLSDAEKGEVLGKLLYDELFMQRGKPGFLKERDIPKITSKIAEFFEPVDAAIERRIGQVARDVSAREFFGKIDPEAGVAADINAIDPVSPVGQTLLKEIESGKIDNNGLEVVMANIKNYFENNRGASATAWKINRLMSNVAVFGHMLDFSTAFLNAVDVFQVAAKESPYAAMRAVGLVGRERLSRIPGLSGIKPEVYTRLEDIGIHHGNIETADFARTSGKSTNVSDRAINSVAKFLRNSMKHTTDLMDTIGKEVKLNAARIRASEVARDPGNKALFSTADANFDAISKRMMDLHPDLWPAMLESLKSEGFRKNDLDAMGSLYLYDRVADTQPVGRAERPTGELALHPGFKSMFRLKGFMLRQLGDIRNNVYENMKKGNIADASIWFGIYSSFVMAGNFIMRCAIAKAQNKPCDTKDLFFNHLLNLTGVNRHTLATSRNEGVVQAAVEIITPPATVIKSAAEDLGLVRDAFWGRKYEGGGYTARSLEDIAAQSEMIKHVPYIGRELDAYIGPGKKRSEKLKRDIATGRERSALDEISDIIVAPPKKRN